MARSGKFYALEKRSVLSEIAGASAEQSSGVDEVNRALSQMDEVTQQNSALVEENAATAKALETQAKAMDQRVSFFRLNETPSAGAAAKARSEAIRRRQPSVAVTSGAHIQGALALKEDAEF